MLRAAALLVLSNVFMTFAWYGHLRHTHRALWLVVVVSWGIAFFEYCLQVPANRLGYAAGMSGAELKTLQEVITLTVFIGFAIWYLREPIRWNIVAGFLLIALGATLVFAPWSKRAQRDDAAAARQEVVRAR
ncbi:MAG TPA: DMT family protein [Longimicrobiales bacterium]